MGVKGRFLVVCLLLLVVVACGGQEGQETRVPTAADTAVLPLPTAEPTAGGPAAVPTATPPPTVTPRPSATPLPTPRPLAEGECIAWYETPSFLGREVCVEGKVNFVRSANPARTLVFLVLDPAVPDIDHCCGLFYGWLYVDKMYDAIPTGGLRELFEGKCVRLHGTVEKAEGRGRCRMPIKALEQLDIIECSDCQIPGACGL